MISPEALCDALKARDVRLFAGVPDSLLKSFCAYIDDQGAWGEHIITANEGNAVAVAAGYHMATGKLAAVYLQNSGLGNTINPLTSLADAQVYRIPMLLIIGWRGEPGVKDEPQHLKQGRITRGQLDLLEIPHWIVEAGSDLPSTVAEVFRTIEETGAPVALLIRADAFADYKSKRKSTLPAMLTREEALRTMLAMADAGDLVVSTTGKTSREVFELRVQRNEAQRDFLTVGGMGHTASLALGVALGRPEKRVLCFDGDGSVLMHMGALPIIGSLRPRNLLHVVLNNAAHESVGGQPTVAGEIDFGAIARACGYAGYEKAQDAESLERAWQRALTQGGPFLLEVRIQTGSRNDLGRPTSTPEQNKRAFMEHVRA